MALPSISIRCQQCLLLRHGLQNLRSCSSNKLAIRVNTLDDFLSQLMENKAIKWNREALKKTENLSHAKNIKIVNHKSNLEILGTEEINNLFQEANAIGDDNRVLELLENCLHCKKYVPLPHIGSILALCAQRGEKTLLLHMKELCTEKYPELLEAHSDFKLYIAEATWIAGNVPESIKLFEKLYDSNCFLRRRIRLTLKNLIKEHVNKRSEAVLVNITNFAEKLSQKYMDFFPLLCVWQVCILSEWFSDQNLALDLLNKNPGLLQAVNNKLQYVIVVSLYNHRIEVVYRIMEILLKNDLKIHYSGALLALLDYQSKYDF